MIKLKSLQTKKFRRGNSSVDILTRELFSLIMVEIPYKVRMLRGGWFFYPTNRSRTRKGYL